MDKVNEQLRNIAVQKGMCSDWQQGWMADKTLDELCDMYIDGMEFTIANDYPSNKLMKQMFNGVMQRHNIFVDDEVRNVKNPFNCVLNGKCDAKVSFDGHGIGKVYARHDTELSLTVSGFAIVYLEVFDNAKVNISCSDGAKVFIRYNVFDKDHKTMNVTVGGNGRIVERTCIRKSWKEIYDILNREDC